MRKSRTRHSPFAEKHVLVSCWVRLLNVFCRMIGGALVTCHPLCDAPTYGRVEGGIALGQPFAAAVWVNTPFLKQVFTVKKREQPHLYR